MVLIFVLAACVLVGEVTFKVVGVMLGICLLFRIIKFFAR